MLADLDRAGFVARQADAGDRRRTMAQITPGRRTEIQEWLDHAAAPLARVLDRLDLAEQAAFLEAMNMLETELSARDTTDQGSGWPAATLAHTRFSGTAADEREPAHARCRAPTYCIQRMVLLTHPRSRLGNCARPTVHVATTTGQVIRMLDDSTTKLSGHEREQVERLILRDHGFHASRRKPH